MSRFKRVLALWFVSSCVWPLGASGADAPPVESFVSRPKIQQAILSPSGKWLAVTAPAGTGRLALAVVDSEGIAPPVVVAGFSNVDVLAFEWVNDERLVFSVGDLSLGFGEQVFTRGLGDGLHSVRRNGEELRQLIHTRLERVREMREAGVRPLETNHDVLAVPTQRSDETIIVGEYIFDIKGDLDGINPMRLNVATGRTESLALGRPPFATRWLFDSRGEPRAVIATHEGLSRIFWRDKAGDPWREIASYPSMQMGFSPFAVDGKGNLYGLVPEGPTQVATLRRFDFASGKPAEDALVRTPGFDFHGALIESRADGRVVGVRALTDAETTVWFEPAMKRIQGAVDQKFPGRVNHVSCGDCGAPDVVLVTSYSDQDPGSIWVHRPAQDAWHLVGRRRPDIDPAQMGRLDLHRIKARDGRELPVWVTTPKAAAKKAPAVVLVHGGPQVRGGSWHWDGQAQLLASRGYVVIEPEFRGSEGYGRAHLEAGWKHWGDTMQDDNEDALAWAVAQGLVDPKRACIAGASYGGYATLMSLIRHPDTYRCGVAWVAVTDPRLLFNEEWQSDLPIEWQRYGLPLMLGDPKVDADLLRRSAPVERAGEIRVPVLLAFGGDDRRVPIEHGNKMRSAMTAAGHPPQWIVYPGEGHGWRTQEHQVDFWRRVDAFLARQLN